MLKYDYRIEMASSMFFKARNRISSAAVLYITSKSKKIPSLLVFKAEFYDIC